MNPLAEKGKQMRTDTGHSRKVTVKNASGRLKPVHAQSLTGKERLWHLPSDMGQGVFKTEFMDSGLSLTHSRCRLNTELYAMVADVSDAYTLVFSLEGRSLNKNRCLKQGFEMTGGTNCLYRFPERKMVRESPKGQRLSAVVITIPESRLEAVAEEFSDREPPGGTAGNGREFIFQKNVSSPPMQQILHQIIQCRYHGRIRRLFLEGKALELLALKLEMIRTARIDVPKTGVSDDQMAGVLAARDLLLADICHPPTIHELARAAGMSHPRLGKLFKAVFGCSPFELLRNKRLEWARDLVAANEISMTQIAYETGYAGSSHFSKAFFERFGIQPSRYRKEVVSDPFYSLP